MSELTGTAATYAATVLQDDRVDVLHRVLTESVDAVGARSEEHTSELQSH